MQSGRNLLFKQAVMPQNLPRSFTPSRDYGNDFLKEAGVTGSQNITSAYPNTGSVLLTSVDFDHFQFRLGYLLKIVVKSLPYFSLFNLYLIRLNSVLNSVRGFSDNFIIFK